VKLSICNCPKVSVLMCVFNGERYLREAINSILNQTLSDFEFLIIDDGSTDDSVKIIQDYQDGRIRLIQNGKNLGLTKSLCVGVAKARGEYIARMDGDDVAMPNRLTAQVYHLENNREIGLVGSSHYLIDEKGEIKGAVDSISDHTEIVSRFANGLNSFCHPSTLYRRDIVVRVGGYREFFEVAQDYDLWTRILEVCEVANIDERLIKFRVHSKSISGRAKSQQHAYRHLALLLMRQRQKYGVDSLRHAYAGKKCRKERTVQAAISMFKMSFGWRCECLKLTLKKRMPRLLSGVRGFVDKPRSA
jgi:glycosyltransferase involved in cell wall biosynthesis